MKLLVLSLAAGCALAVCMVAWSGRPRGSVPLRAEPQPLEELGPSPKEHPVSLQRAPASIPAVLPLRQPDQQVAEPVVETSSSDPHECDELRAENRRLAEEIASLRREIELLLAHERRTPWEHFLHLPDAERITDPKDRALIKQQLWNEFPFYLQESEALQLLQMWKQDKTSLYANETWGGHPVLRFLGPQRVLREAPSWWIQYMQHDLSEEEWLLLFGTPMPDSHDGPCGQGICTPPPLLDTKPMTWGNPR
jgi:hypothetical protein